MNFCVRSPQYRPRILSFGYSLGQAQITTIQAIPETANNEIDKITCVAEGASAQADFFVVANAAGDTMAAWINKNGNDTEPTAQEYLDADFQIEIPVVTADTAATVAASAEAATDGILDDVTVTVSGAVVTYTNDIFGSVQTPRTYNAAGTSNGPMSASIFAIGADSSLNSKYFLYSTPSNNYCFYFDVEGQGVDPSISGYTSEAIDLDPMDSEVQVAAAIASVMDALSDIGAAAVGSLVTATNGIGACASASNGNSGFIVIVTQVGADPGLRNGKFDAVVVNSNPGEYTFTFDEQFLRVPEIVVLSKTAQAPRIASSSVSGCVVQLNDLSGTIANSEFSMIVLGSQSSADLLNY